jgi:hypothetical protein
MNDLTLLAIRLARECRLIIQTALREEEWLDAEEEFRWVILAGLKQLQPPSARPQACASCPAEDVDKSA